MNENETTYKTMKLIGAANIAIGIVSLIIGVATGTLCVISGASLMRRKEDLTI